MEVCVQNQNQNQNIDNHSQGNVIRESAKEQRRKAKSRRCRTKVWTEPQVRGAVLLKQREPQTDHRHEDKRGQRGSEAREDRKCRGFWTLSDCEVREQQCQNVSAG